MAVDFNAIFKKIITVEELRDFSTLEEKLNDIQEGFIFQNNRPTHVIMTISEYEALQNAAEAANIANGATAVNGENIANGANIVNAANEALTGSIAGFEEKKEAENKSTDGLEVILNKIGKKIFVKYYYAFKSDDSPEEALVAEKFTIASRRSRSSSARWVFRNRLEVEALKSIIASDRVDIDTRHRAEEILTSEMKEMHLLEKTNASVENGDFSEDAITPNDMEAFDETANDIKIGQMAKNVLTKLMENKVLSKTEINQLSSLEYCNSNFLMNFPILKKVEAGEDVDELKRDSRGYNRYYGNPVVFEDQKFLITSQWRERHKKAFEAWCVDKLAALVKEKADEMPAGKEFCVRDVLSAYWPYLNFSVKKRIGLKFKSMAQEDGKIEFGEMKNGCQYYWKE